MKSGSLQQTFGLFYLLLAGVAMTPEKIEFLSAVLLVSKEPARLAAFYRQVVGLPLEDERHGDTAPHYGCELGDLHFAIHPMENFSGTGAGAGSVKLAFTVFDLAALAGRLEAAGIKLAYPPKDTGFALMTAIHDPDGNFIEFTQLSDGWFKHLEKRRARGYDVIERWKANRG